MGKKGKSTENGERDVAVEGARLEEGDGAKAAPDGDTAAENPKKRKGPKARVGEFADGVKRKMDGVKPDKDPEPDEYDRAVMAYNGAYNDLSDAGLNLLRQRERSMDLIGHVEHLVNSIANHPKTFDTELGEVSLHRDKFKEAEEFARREVAAARKSATGAGVGVTVGMTVASLAPSAAIWVATTFGTASTGTAISTLTGAAATNAALAWLGGGAIAAGGGGMVAGETLLALAGPVGWGVAGATLLMSIVLFTKKKVDLRGEKRKALRALTENTGRVSKMGARVIALETNTNDLREGLSDLYGRCAASYGADYMELGEDDRCKLAAMVNNVLSLSRLLGKQLDDGEGAEGLAGR